jgi:VanZ family protein
MSVKSKIKVGGVALLVLLLVFAALGPAKLQLRTGLGWRFDHVAGYFGFTVMFCMAWARPVVVGGALIATAMLLEALQALTPDRCCDLEAALLSAGGALAGALVADLFLLRIVKQLKARTLLMPQRFMACWQWWNNAGTGLVTAFRRGRVPGSGVARGVIPQSQALARVVSQQLRSS